MVEELQRTPLIDADASEVLIPMHSQNQKLSPALLVSLVVVIVLSGMGTGFALAQMKPAGMPTNSQGKVAAPSDLSTIKSGQTYGQKDGSAFKDQAEGVLVKGGVDGEGTHHLIRPGGKSQYVYLTSSVVDLDAFAGSRVMVKGDTFQAQKVGWLMDVGQVVVQAVDVSSPDETTPEPNNSAD